MLNVVIEYALHQTVSSKLLLNVSPKTGFCLELNWFEVLDILWVEEHITNSGFLLVDAQWVAGQHYTFKDYA